MKTAYLFHDAFSDQLSDWYPWMKTTLETFGYVTVVPNFPTPAGQSYESWRAVIKNYIPTFDAETILIGHGSGGLFALRLAEESAKQIRGLFLVAAYSSKIGHVGYDRVNESMIHDFDFAKIKNNCTMIELFAGDDDPFVPKTISEKLADDLGVQAQFIPQGGHINRASGFMQLVAVASAIKDSQGVIGGNLQTENDENNQDTNARIPTEKETPKDPIAPLVPEGKNFLRTEADDVATKNSSSEISSKKIVGLETMYDDMTHLVNSNQGRVASSLLNQARKDEKIKREVSPSSPKNIFYIVGTIIVILIGLGVVGLVIQSNAAVAPKALQSAPIASLISSDAHVAIAMGAPAYALAANITSALSQPGADGTVLDIDYTNGSGLATFAQVASEIGVTVPDAMLAVLPQSAGNNPTFMHGQAFSGTTAEPFLVLPITDYSAAFSAMRAWEPTLFRDTGIFMNVSDDFLKNYLNAAAFDDELIDNHQVRVLRYAAPPADNSGNAAITSPYQNGDVMLAYFFLNDHALVIVSNPDVIPILLQRYDDRQVFQQ